MKVAELRTSLLPRSGKVSPGTARTAKPGPGPLPAELGPSPATVPPKVASEVSNRALFQVNSVVGQVWLMQLHKRIRASYSRLNCGRPTVLQTGYAGRSFSTFFEPLSEIEIVRLFENLLAFANFDEDAPARSFFLAYAPLAFEHDLSGEYIGPGVWSPPSGSTHAARRVRRTLQRWCDWLEAFAHFQVHCECRAAAVCPEMEKAIILLWPLVKRHQWSSADLLRILRSSTGCGERFPCQSAEQLANFCQTGLGLHFSQSTAEPLPAPLPGQEVAARLMKFLPSMG